MDLRKLATEYFESNKLMQLATISDKGPWICNVYFVVDDSFNIYWTSGRDRQHSIEILRDERAAVTVVKDNVKKQALQIVGSASDVEDDQLPRVHELYMSRFGEKDYDLEEMKLRKPTGRAYWVLKPATISFWDEVNFPDNPKQSFNLS